MSLKQPQKDRTSMHSRRMEEMMDNPAEAEEPSEVEVEAEAEAAVKE